MCGFHENNALRQIRPYRLQNDKFEKKRIQKFDEKALDTKSGSTPSWSHRNLLLEHFFGYLFCRWTTAYFKWISISTFTQYQIFEGCWNIRMWINNFLYNSIERTEMNWKNKCENKWLKSIYIIYYVIYKSLIHISIDMIKIQHPIIELDGNEYNVIYSYQNLSLHVITHDIL